MFGVWHDEAGAARQLREKIEGIVAELIICCALKDDCSFRLQGDRTNFFAFNSDLLFNGA